MARKQLGDLLGTIVETQAPESPEPAAAMPPAEPQQVVATPTAPAKPKKAPSQAASTRPATVSEEPETGPRYLQLTRKEARLTDGQLDELTLLTRQLNKARRGDGERITDNTLIRVAVDLLLQQREKLTGATEEELRASVGLRIRRSVPN